MEMGHHALAFGSTPLSWMGRNSSMGMEKRECGWLERQNVSQGIHRKHNSMQGRSVLRVNPHPPFIAFPRGFRVLSLG